MNSGKEMPKYKCHKEVWALKIEKFTENPNGSIDLFFEEDGYAPINLDKKYLPKHKPEVGGYYIVYKDNYRSFSPAKAFEEGYTKI